MIHLKRFGYGLLASGCLAAIGLTLYFEPWIVHYVIPIMYGLVVVYLLGALVLNIREEYFDHD